MCEESKVTVFRGCFQLRSRRVREQSDHESFNLVLKMMREEGIVPTLITYNTRLMESTARRDWREAARAYKELLLDGLLPDS